MAESYVGDQIGIRSTTDTVEQVKEALGSHVGIRESGADETEEETKETKEEKPPAETPKGEPADETEETEEEKETREAAEAEAANKAEKEKAKKGAMPVVPRARLNEVLRERDALKRQLAEKEKEPEPERVAAETKPETFSGQPEPKIEDYLSSPEKYPDPYGALIKEHGAWVRLETRAELAYEQNVEKAAKAREEQASLYQAAIPAALEQRPDYWDVVKENKDVLLSGYVQGYCEETDSGVGPLLLLYMIEHPDEREKINKLRTKGVTAAMGEIEEAILAEIGESGGEPPKKKSPIPLKKEVSKAPLPASRIKSSGPGPKSLQELAGPTDKEGVRVEYNPAYTAAVKARRGT